MVKAGEEEIVIKGPNAQTPGVGGGLSITPIAEEEEENVTDGDLKDVDSPSTSASEHGDTISPTLNASVSEARIDKHIYPRNRRSSTFEDVESLLSAIEKSPKAEVPKKKGHHRRSSSAGQLEHITNTFVANLSLVEGHTRNIINEIHERDGFAIFRSVNPETNRWLPLENVKAKTMSVKGKSAIYGPIAGLVALDTELSKSEAEEEKSKFQTSNSSVLERSKRRRKKKRSQYRALMSNPDRANDKREHRDFVERFNASEIVRAVGYKVKINSMLNNEEKEFKLLYQLNDYGIAEKDEFGRPIFWIKDQDKEGKDVYRKYAYLESPEEEAEYVSREGVKFNDKQLKEVELLAYVEIEIDPNTGFVKIDANDKPAEKLYYITPDYDLLTMAFKCACDWFENINHKGVYAILKDMGIFSDQDVDDLDRDVSVKPVKRGDEHIPKE